MENITIPPGPDISQIKVSVWFLASVTGKAIEKGCPQRVSPLLFTKKELNLFSGQ